MLRKVLPSLVIIMLLFPLFAKSQWAALNFNTVYNNYAVSFINETVGFVSGGMWQGPPPGINNTYLYKTVNGGQSWATVFDNDKNTPISQLKYYSESSGLMKRWQDDVNKTNDGGFTQRSILSSGQSSSGYRFQALNPDIYFYSNNNKLYFTANGGVSWETKNLTSIPTHTNGNTFVQFYDHLSGYIWGETYYSAEQPVRTEFKVYTTNDRGANLTECFTLTEMGGFYSHYAKIKIVSSSIAILCLDNLIMRTADFGKTWKAVYTANVNEYWSCVDARGNVVYVGGSNGKIICSLDSGKTFNAENSHTTNGISDINIADQYGNIVYAACGKGQILKQTKIVTLVAEMDKKEHLIVFPNPANNQLHISLNLEEQKNVSLELYNSIGILVYANTFRDFPGGSLQDVNVSDFPKGCYFLKMRTDKYVHSEKVILQ